MRKIWGTEDGGDWGRKKRNRDQEQEENVTPILIVFWLIQIRPKRVKLTNKLSNNYNEEIDLEVHHFLPSRTEDKIPVTAESGRGRRRPKALSSSRPLDPSLTAESPRVLRNFHWPQIALIVIPFSCCLVLYLSTPSDVVSLLDLSYLIYVYLYLQNPYPFFSCIQRLI